MILQLILHVCPNFSRENMDTLCMLRSCIPKVTNDLRQGLGRVPTRGRYRPPKGPADTNSFLCVFLSALPFSKDLLIQDWEKLGICNLKISHCSISSRFRFAILLRSCTLQDGKAPSWRQTCRLLEFFQDAGLFVISTSAALIWGGRVAIHAL